jgi:hypothetical protein
VIGFEPRPGPAWEECNLSGGNLVAFAADGVTTISPVYPTAFVFIAKTSSSSATQSDLAAIQYSSYGGRVSMDINSNNVGTAYPSGNVEYPVNNFTDTLDIAIEKGFTNVEVRESCVLNSGNFSGFNIYGRSHVNTTITIESPANVSNITLKKFRIEGVLDGGTEVSDCVIGDVIYFNGHIHNSSLGGRLTLGGNNESYLNDCGRLASEEIPIIDFDNGDNHLVLSNYTGVIKFVNMTVDSVNVMCGIAQGMIIVDSATCTAGAINAIGVGFIRDELGNNIPSGMWNGVSVNNMLISNESIVSAMGDLSVDTEELAEAVWAYNREA